MNKAATPHPLRNLGECAEVIDRFRRPINVEERKNRTGKIPYYGANGAVGTIDEWIFDEELVLVAEDGGFFDDPNRPIAYRVSGKSWVNNHAPVLRPRDGVDVDWLNFSIVHQDVRQFIKGATLKKLNQKDLRRIPVPCPPLEEQRRIVARIKECMARVDEIEALRGESVAESEALLPSMLNQKFVDLFNRYQSVDIGTLAEETRYGTSQKCNTNGVGMPILRIPNVAGGFVNYENLKHCPLGQKDQSRITLKNGDLLFVRTNGSKNLVGRCAVYEDDADEAFGFASYLIRVRLDKSRVLPHFVAFFLNSTHGRQEIDRRRRTSAGQFNINSENLRSIELPLPPIAVQDSIVSELRERQHEIMALQTEVLGAKQQEDQLRESILRKAFAGEL